MADDSRDRQEARGEDSLQSEAAELELALPCTSLAPAPDAAPEGDVVTDLPVIEDLERLVRKLKNFPSQPVNRVVSASDIRELEKAIGLIGAIAFEIVEET